MIGIRPLIFCILLLTPLAKAFPTQPEQPLNQPMLRVLIQEAPLLSLPEASYRIQTENQKELHTPLSLEVLPIPQALLLNGTPFSCPLQIAPQLPDQPIKLGKRSYRGTLKILCTKGKLQAVNLVPLEAYLKGVMKMEIAPYFEKEAQKAQAVIARTYALYRASERKSERYDLVSTVEDQVYAGVAGEDPVLSQAVDATRGEVLLFQGKLALTLYFSESGGTTESAKAVFGTDYPYLRARRLPKAVTMFPSPRAHWTLTLTADELLRALQKLGYSASEIFSLNVAKRSSSGRAEKLAITTESGTLTIPAHAFRLALGPSLLRSTLFQVTPVGEALSLSSHILASSPIADRGLPLSLASLYAKPTSSSPSTPCASPCYALTAQRRPLGFLLRGRGFGHGVGLSQWDANALAHLGYTYRRILAFFYPGTELASWPSPQGTL